MPVINHVWGSAIAVTTNMHLLAAMPHLPGGLHPWEPMLEFDTTPNRFRDEMLTEPLEIQRQVRENAGTVGLPRGPGLGVAPDPEFLSRYKIAVLDDYQRVARDMADWSGLEAAHEITFFKTSTRGSAGSLSDWHPMTSSASCASAARSRPTSSSG